MSRPHEQPASPSADQLKALAHPVRLRILRLCWHQELTNKELADRLGMVPGAVLRHVRELVKAGFLAATPVRTGQRGAMERPYRATGAQIGMAAPATEHADLARQVELAVVATHYAELVDAPPWAMRSQERSLVRLPPEALAEFTHKVEALIADYVARDDPDGIPVNLLWSLHEVARPRPPESPT